MFQNSLKNLITDFDEHNTLWRVLMQSVNDHGGGASHLNALLDDAKGPRLLVDEIARLVIGKIWKLAGQSIDLGLTPDDFRCSPKEFLARYPGLTHPNAEFDIGKWSETEPKEQCRYRLHHFGRPVLVGDVVQAFDSTLHNLEILAGWRELVAYVSKLQMLDLSECTILAAGSRLFESHYVNMACVVGKQTFPAAHGFKSKKEIEVSWEGVKKAETDHFRIDNFWLIRVYD